MENLSNSFPNYTWSSRFKGTENVSGFTPTNIQGDYFDSSNITWALNELNSPSSYGGCGPIAIIGVLDYLYNCLGYEEIMSNPVNSDYKKSISYDALSFINTLTIDPAGDYTWSFPSLMVSGFNDLMDHYGLSNIISASATNFLPFFQNQKWELIVENIEEGLPVTLMVGLPYEIGRPCDEHCCNIVGYEIFKGYNSSSGDIIEKKYMVVRLNFTNADNLYYCDADVLNLPFVGLITYSINYSSNRQITAFDFANDFVNNDGNGQYFFYNIDKTVWISDTYRVNTSRLRCSYIENEFLVLSPKRQNAGTAYLSISTMHQIQKMRFDSALWGVNEDHAGLTFKVQYMKDYMWYDHIEINMMRISRIKSNPDEFVVLFPNHVHRFRFYITHNNPSGNSNRGRTILDNIRFYYNTES